MYSHAMPSCGTLLLPVLIALAITGSLIARLCSPLAAEGTSCLSCNMYHPEIYITSPVVARAETHLIVSNHLVNGLRWSFADLE